MAKLPKVLKNIQREESQRRRFQTGGDTTDEYGHLAFASSVPPQKTTLETGEQPAVAQMTPQTTEFLETEPVQLGTAPTMTPAQAA